jgi:hypothetical protein
LAVDEEMVDALKVLKDRDSAIVGDKPHQAFAASGDNQIDQVVEGEQGFDFFSGQIG